MKLNRLSVGRFVKNADSRRGCDRAEPTRGTACFFPGACRILVTTLNYRGSVMRFIATVVCLVPVALLSSCDTGNKVSEADLALGAQFF